MQNILVLGAGLVSRPLVFYLLKKKYRVTVASRTVSKAEVLIQGFDNGKAITLNINDPDLLNDLIAQHDLVISLVPYTYHVTIAKLCIKYQKHLVTTSYVSEAMQGLDSAARKSNILILNEIGLDPGIDHMSAMKIIHDVQKKGGKVVSFKSYCGGLPALQSNTSPFGYKFSWSPRGVVMAGKNNGQYLKNGKIVFIPSKDLFKNYEIIDIEGMGSLEAYTNRDALPYQKLYGLEHAHTVFRGTLRNIGWCYTMKKAQELGLFDDAQRSDLKGLSYKQLMLRLVGADEETDDALVEIAWFLNLEEHASVMKKFEWLGLFSNKSIPGENNVMDIFSTLLQEKLAMGRDDLDLIVLYHRFLTAYENKEELITSTLIQTGQPEGDSAMSRTVSLPAAIAASLLLDKKIDLTGVHIPVHPKIYNPVLTELAKMGIECIDKAIVL